MESIRKWLYKPKRDDKSLLAQFFYADEDLNMVANELDSFDGRKDPERCTSLVNQLRQSQDKVLTITNAIMDVLIGDERANRDFRVKFPEDVLQENLAGQLWFGAECLAAGSSIMNRESESTAMRPLARAVTKSLENVRNLLRDTCLRNNTPNGPIKLDTNELVTEMLIESLKIFDRLFAEFELAYVSAMVPVKSTQEYELQELIGVLFSETLQRSLKMKLLTQDMVDDCDPALMFTIPRLAIVSGLIIFPNGPLCIDKSVDEMSEMFRPFRTLLHKIRSLLWLLDNRELYMLEKLLCDNEQISDIMNVSDVNVNNSDLNTFFNQFYNDYPLSKEYANSFCHEKIIDGNTSTTTTTMCTSNNCDLQRNIDTPSTSTGYLIPNAIVHNSLLVTTASNNMNIDSPPDRDSLEVISVAAATLSSILTSCDNKQQTNQTPTTTTDLNDNKDKINNDMTNNMFESPNDSGICTENTSLDRSPSLDLNDLNVNNSPRNLKRFQQQQQTDYSPSTSSRLLPMSAIMSRKRNNRVIREKEDDCSSTGSSDTSSFNSNCVDDGEIALAMQAAEIASRNEIRARYRSSEDLLHRLFVCIAGVADQLQTNFACDLRNILKSVFLINASSDQNCSDLPPKSLDTTSLDSSIEYHPPEEDVIETNEFSVDPNILAQEALFDTNVYFHLDNNDCDDSDYSNHPRQSNVDDRSLTSLSSDLNRYASLREDVANLRDDDMNNQHEERPPIWIPDVEAPKCMSCSANFTVVKRRHHCRNCGKVFCARCSSNSVPLPKFGHMKPVRVCNKCFIYNLTPFTM